ncbi:alpha/beta hydrolase [Cohnella sp. REN36]|uniref:alpha/beta hydrolase n=1 Tax=Cohnella sp. REN36 TaxID=2887347 RepID=UPI001D1528B4|nr:alpha/beta hydrolase [Cohnella sp. REN36]MCC3375917.1 alpha/beta fold hydrolase [Cohnella sp. REN36]
MMGLWILIIVAAILAAGAAFVWLLTRKAQRPRQLPNETAPNVPYEEVSWNSGGQLIRGWFLPPPDAAAGEPQPAVVVAHGWGSNRSRVLRYAGPLHEAGFAVLLYDVRAHGDSGPHPAPSGLLFYQDLEAAIDWLGRHPDVDASRIGVLGHSLGAFGAVLALDAGAPIAALVTDAMPVRFATMVEAELKRRGLPAFPLAQLIPQVMVWRSRIPRRVMKRADPARILADNAQDQRVPTLHVHSRRDGFIPPSELDHVLSRTPSLSHLYVDVEGHSASERDPAFWETVLPFFRTHLSVPKKSGPASHPAASPKVI